MRPSCNPSPLVATHGCKYQFCFIFLKSNKSVNSEVDNEFGKSCLFAKIKKIESFNSGSSINRNNSYFTSSILSLSFESTTKITQLHAEK